MESVSEDTLRIFAGMFPHPFITGAHSNSYWKGFLAEQVGFYELGARLGYFDRDFTSHAEVSFWPKFAGEYLRAEDEAVSQVLLEPPGRASAEITSLFQAALLLANRFNHHLIVALQRALQDQESVLDDGEARCTVKNCG